MTAELTPGYPLPDHIGPRSTISRRRWLQSISATTLGGMAAGVWGDRFSSLAAAMAAKGQRQRSCILLWMTGGPSQLDTFDMKPNHANGGEFKEIETSVPGLRISEHLPRLARQGESLAVIRSLSTKEGDHGRGTYLMRTGRQPGGPIRFPTVGAVLAKSLGDEAAELPSFVSVAPYQVFNRQAFGPGFLGPRYAPLTVGAVDAFQANVNLNQPQNGYAELRVDDLRNRLGDRAREDVRLDLWRDLQHGFLKDRPSGSAQSHNTAYERAIRMMHSEAAQAFDLEQEPDQVREAYGRTRFGQGCLLARRLVERGVPFVEVSLGSFGGGSLGWDTHQGNFPAVRNLSAELDAGWGTLMNELRERGLLDTTTILWLGEFGRTPAINRGGGRDHFPAAWSAVLAGGGIRGGQAYGKTSEDGTTVEDGKTDVGDLLATLCKAVGLDPHDTNMSEVGRPIRLADGEPISALLT